MSPTLPTVNQNELSALFQEALKLTSMFATGVTGGPAGYAAAALEVAGIYNEIAAIINSSGNVTEQDIQAAHADAQTIHDARKPAPPPPPPVWPFYGQIVDSDPGDAVLATGDFVFANADRTKWYVNSPGVPFTAPDGFTLVRTVGQPAPTAHVAAAAAATPIIPYGKWEPGALPSNDDLKRFGFKAGDIRWYSSTDSSWTVTREDQAPGKPTDGGDPNIKGAIV